jgi:hypothetical protein
MRLLFTPAFDVSIASRRPGSRSGQQLVQIDRRTACVGGHGGEMVTGPPPGQRDYSSVRLTRHALERFVERFAVEPSLAAQEFRYVLARTRRLGRNPGSGAIAVLGIYRKQVLVAIVQEATCLTVLTWNQFVPRLAEFGRHRLPRKWGRVLRRLAGEG